MIRMKPTIEETQKRKKEVNKRIDEFENKTANTESVDNSGMLKRLPASFRTMQDKVSASV